MIVASKETASRVTTTDHSGEERWQQRKSAMTREGILSAAVECLVEQGYTGLTTIEVARRAEVSRGAMHHHFANRTELVTALIDWVLHQRLERFLTDYVSAIENVANADFFATAAELHWQGMLAPEYTAYIELAMAARTDSDLSAILVPATKAFDREWTAAMRKAFPEWESRAEAMQLASDMANAVHLGLYINRPFMGDAARRNAVRKQLVAVVESIYREAEQ